MNVSRKETQAKLDLLIAGVSRHVPEQDYTVSDRFEECASQCPNQVFLVYRGSEITFAEINRRANRFAHIAMKFGAAPGGVAAVMLENRPEFFYAWLGLAKIGVTVALLNTQARGPALDHAIDQTGSKLLFLGGECEARFATVPGLAGRVETLYVADGERETVMPRGLKSVGDYLADVSAENPDRSLRSAVVGETPVSYVFTSGTTGLPKAAIVSHMRWLGVGEGWASVLGMTSEDVFYCVLPLFHNAAGMSLVANALAARARIVLRRQFSASRFWPDVREHGVTIVQYVGEICRYLINMPPGDNDREHSLKRMTGAGMTAEVWNNFVARFGNIDIYEGWGATEANCSMMNLDGVVGSCGRIPFKERSNARLVRYDIENDCHIRDQAGFLVECEPEEVGELLGRVLNIPGVGAGRFEGYVSAEETEKKILRNVFETGDAWYRSGDLLRHDAEGYFFFSDRIGDTYRWKSENVSTTEVTEALENYSGAEMINVYGVTVPGHEGRAGMVAIELKAGATFDAPAFYEMALAQLPAYAVPLFVRIRSHSDLTVTFKLKKVELQKAGYSPENFDDLLFVLDDDAATYKPYSEAALARLGVPPYQMLESNLTESERLESLKGKRLGPYLSYNPVSATQIWLWCSAMGDNNPGYLPGEDQIAPPAMMQMWTMRDINDRSAPGSTEASQYQVFDDMKALGYPANVAVSYDITFHRTLKPGDRAKHYSTVVNISDRKTTALGTGFFVTERVEYLTREDQLFAEALISYFQYLPPGTSSADAKEEAPVQTAESRAEKTTGEIPAAAVSSWKPDYVNLDPGKVSVGDALPPLVLPITHKLIVGGAMATQDFIPVHHNVPEARAAGMADIFMNILTTSGLCARYIGDWAGADSRLKQLSFKLLAPNFPGDTMVMEGQVTAVSPEESTAEISIAFGGKNGLGYHTRGTATLEVPATGTTQ